MFFQNIKCSSSISIMRWLLSMIDTSFVASYSIDMLNVIYRSHTPYSARLLTAKICSLISLYIVNYQECFKKNNNDENFLQK